MAGKGTAATLVVQRAGVPHALHAYRHDPAARAFGTEAVQALGLDPDRTFKTLIAVAGDRSRTVSALVAVGGQLDLKELAVAVGVKQMSLTDPALAQRTTGYVLGGISPLGQRRRLATFIDSSALQFPTVFVSAGRRGLELELSPTDLVALTDATLVAITR